MDRHHFTFMVIADPAEPPRTVQVSRRAVRWALGGIGVFVLLLLVGSAGLILKAGEAVKTARLERENRLLVSSLERMRQKVDQLSQSVAGITERDRRFRLLAGLPEIDTEVRQVGIGGPGTGSIENEPLFSVNTDLSGDVFGTGSKLDQLLRQANLLQVSLDEASRAMESYRDHLAGYPSIDPVEGWLSSTFSSSRYHPLLNVRRPHEGIDISAWPGTPVVATADGVVDFAGWRPGYGYTVEIEHEGGFETRYAHNQKNLQVKVGDSVRRGDVVAYVGNSGLANGPHVHYEVIRNGRAVNPAEFRLQQVIVE